MFTLLAFLSYAYFSHSLNPPSRMFPSINNQNYVCQRSKCHRTRSRTPQRHTASLLFVKDMRLGGTCIGLFL
ncbi:hypothetical protein HDK64DRAFT_259934, partial [Phyllosticta capitalensis]